jgi:hypothetical protein
MACRVARATNGIAVGDLAVEKPLAERWRLYRPCGCTAQLGAVSCAATERNVSIYGTFFKCSGAGTVLARSAPYRSVNNISLLEQEFS